MLKAFFIFLFFSGLALLKIGLIGHLPYPFNHTELIIGVLWSMIAFGYFFSAAWGSIVYGGVIGIFSFGQFGITMLALFVACLTTNLMFRHFFTHASTYSLYLLGLLFGFIFFVLQDTLRMVYSAFHLISFDWSWSFDIKVLVFHVLAILITMKITHFFLKPKNAIPLL